MTSKKPVITAIITSVIAIALLSFGAVRGLDLLAAQNTITDLETEIAATKNTICDTDIQLGLTAANLETATEQLNQTEIILNDTESELDIMQLDLTTIENRLAEKTTELGETKENVADLEGRRVELQALYNEVKVKYDATLIEYKQERESYEYAMKDPSYNEMMIFLSADKTNEKPYIFEDSIFTPESYVCGDYSAETVMNAARQGMRCAFIFISFGVDVMGHACIAFNTTDRGLVFIEPQADAEVELEKGESYWASVIDPVTGIKGNYTNPVDYNDIVEEFIIVW